MKGPVREIPQELLSGFTMGDKIPIIDHYFDDNFETSIRTFSTTSIDNYLSELKEGSFKHYMGQEKYLVPMIKRIVKNKDVLVIGSVSPAIESVCIYYGAKSVSTLEYNEINCEDNRIKTYVLCDGLDKKFDAIISYSSFEHSGLGRYGDQLDPDGDLKAMDLTKSLLNDNGLLLLAVPFGKDELRWNAHRQYGPIRWPLLIKGWDLVNYMPNVNFETFECEVLQPIIILRRK